MPKGLSQILQDVPSQGDDQSAIDRILDAVRAHLGMEIAFASRFVDGMREFTHMRSDIPLPLGVGDAEPLEDTFCQRILEGRLPALIHDAKDHPAALELPITSLLPIGSHLNVPLVMGDGSVFGTFCCVSRTPDHSLTQRDLATVRAFADLAASLIDQDRLRQSSQDALRAKVDDVLAGERIAIHLQPIHNLASGEPAGVECLARFSDAGQRPPNEWFEDADRVGRGIELELLAVRMALRCLPYVPAGLYASINASPEAVMSGRLLPLIEGIGRSRLVVEITEHARVDDYAALAAAIADLRRHAQIAIDDVGAGYAGLRHILDLNPDILKLDMSLTRAIDRDPARRALAQALVLFAADIGAKIVAEGIECEGERNALAEIAIELGQGYHFARPMPAVSAQQYFLSLGGVTTDEEPPAAGAPAHPVARRA